MTPRGEELLVRLASWMPFEPAEELLQEMLGIQVSKATARRATLQTGEAALAVCEAEEERLKQEALQAPVEAEKQAMSGDGAFVHLVGGEWVEVKTLVLGEVTRTKRGEICTQHLSYFSRLCDATSFEEAALIETHRRGLERATEVCAVQDGAEWRPRLVDYHRADAGRILDFAHAAEYINEIGQAVQAAGGRLPATWLKGVLHRPLSPRQKLCSTLVKPSMEVNGETQAFLPMRKGQTIGQLCSDAAASLRRKSSIGLLENRASATNDQYARALYRVDLCDRLARDVHDAYNCFLNAQSTRWPDRPRRASGSSDRGS